MELKDRAFIITGGASGLGGACVREFVRHGARVVVCDRAEVPGETSATQVYEKADVTQEADVQRAVDRAYREFGRLDGAVNCAGVATAQRVVDRNGPTPLAGFAGIMNVNAIGTYNVVRLVAAALIASAAGDAEESGVIVNTASVAAFDGQSGQVAYAASKGAVAAMTLPLAREFAQFKIRVVAIAPGIFETPMLAGLPQAARESLAAQVPFPKRLGKPEEFAALARHIVENPMINGEVIRLDGALRMNPR